MYSTIARKRSLSREPTWIKWDNEVEHFIASNVKVIWVTYAPSEVQTEQNKQYIDK